MKRYIIALTSVIAALLPFSVDSFAESTPAVEVMTCKGNDIPYRIPAITRVNAGEHKGRLIALADYRHTRADIGMARGRIDLRMSYSDDNGVTWSEPEPMKDASGNYVSCGTGVYGTFSQAFGDPCIVADADSERILVISCAGYISFAEGRTGRHQQNARWYSEDGGVTWSAVEEMTDPIYALFDGKAPTGKIDSMFITSGRIYQSRYVKKGDYYRLYCALPARCYNAYGNYVQVSYALYSDDFGMTWNVLGDASKPAVPSNGDESKVEELPGGDVLIASRTVTGNITYNIFRFSDSENVEGEWDNAFNTRLNNPNEINPTNGEIRIIPVVNNETGEEAYMAVQSYPFGPGRNYVGISWKILRSDDIKTPVAFGRNWDGRYGLSNRASSYSTMTLTAENHIGVLFEEDRYSCSGGLCIVYKDLPVEEFTDGAWSYTEDPDFAIADKIAGKSAVTEIEGGVADGLIYDLQGMPVKTLQPGQIYVTSAGEKIVMAK